MTKFLFFLVLLLSPKISLAETVINPFEYVLKNSEFGKQNGTTRFYLDINDDKKLDIFAGERWSGNTGGTYFVFLKENKGYRLLGKIYLHPQGFQLLEKKHNGLRDILNYHHLSAFDGYLFTYHFDGKNYVEVSKKNMESKAFDAVIKPTLVKGLDAGPDEKW
jgi:hypothetical protein